MALTKTLPRSVEEWAALPFSDYCETKALAAATAETIYVPTDAEYALFSSDTDIVVRADATATTIADTTTGVGGVINPSFRNVKGVGYLSVIAAVAGAVSVEFFKKPL